MVKSRWKHTTNQLGLKCLHLRKIKIHVATSVFVSQSRSAIFFVFMRYLKISLDPHQEVVVVAYAVQQVGSQVKLLFSCPVIHRYPL